MRRFFTLVVLLLFAIPFGVSISGCHKGLAPVFCNGGDSGLTTGTVTTITLLPKVFGISLNFAEIGQVSTPSATDCKGNTASVGSYTYSTSSMALADIQPTTGRLCGGTWNRNTGGGIADYTYCIPTNNSGIAYIAASADGVTSNPLPVYVHPIVTSIVLGSPTPASTAPITAWSLVNASPNPLVTFTSQNSFAAGQTVSLSNFPNSTFFNGINNAVVQAAGLTATQFTVAIPGLSQPNGSAIETGLAIGPGCTTNPTTACSPAATTGEVTASQYLANSCLSQGSQTQLVAKAYAGTGANQTNISLLVGHLQFSPQTSSIVTIDQNGVATANQPGSTLISANISNAASSAGYFSTCPPASIALTAPGTTTNPVLVNLNNTQPLNAVITDTNGVTLTGLSLEYVSTAPTTLPAGTGSVTPIFAGAGSIYAICQPASCNPASYSQIGLFGNGTPIISNAVNFTTPGTNSTVLYMASTQSLYVVPMDFTSNVEGTPFLLPYPPNSMVISNDGSTIYLGSSTGLMVLNAVNSLSLTRTDTTSPGTVLAVSPDNNTVVLTDPVRQTITLESSSGSVLTTYGGVGTHAVWAPDSQTLYVTTGTEGVLVYSVFTGWTPVTNTVPALDVAVTVPSAGAYFAGTTTTARGFCPISTPTTGPGGTSESNAFYPPADTSAVTTDRLAATDNGLHIIGATVKPTATLNDLLVHIPVGACPSTGGLVFSNVPSTTILSPITATAITGVFPTSDSSIAYVTYTGSGGVLPAYAPPASGTGQITYIKLSGTATAPIIGVNSADNTSFYVGTSGDNLLHIINRATLTDSSTLAPNLTSPGGAIVPVNLLVQKPRKTT
jgi:trimeric autotransporter adhesin